MRKHAELESVMAKIDLFDHPTREPNYRLANALMPWVRQAERDMMLALARPQSGEVVVDLGCGAGTVAVPISRIVESAGHVHAFDGSQQMVENLAETAQRFRLPVTAVKLHKECLPLPDNSADLVTSLAAFHHFADWDRYVSEVGRVLRPGGRLVIGDICSGSRPARYFNGPIHYHCSTGHRFPYLYSEVVKLMCVRVGLAVDYSSVIDVPWQFHDEAEAAWFLNTIHDAQCPPDESLVVAKDFLGWQTLSADEYPFRLNWQLLFVRAVKP